MSNAATPANTAITLYSLGRTFVKWKVSLCDAGPPKMHRSIMLPIAHTADLQLLLATLDAAMTYAQQTGIAAIPMQAPGSTAEAGGGRTLAEQTAEMSVAAREMFDRRARLREGSAIVGGILNAPLVPGR